MENPGKIAEPRAQRGGTDSLLKYRLICQPNPKVHSVGQAWRIEFSYKDIRDYYHDYYARKDEFGEQHSSSLNSSF